VSPAVDLALIALLFVAGSWSGSLAERHFGGTDPGPGVIDEVVGMLVTLWAIPPTWALAIIGFLLFRVLDVVKPWPARQLEELHGGLGMMADDVMAAVYGNLLLRGLVAALPAVAAI
jgi:phosphatidylglycerophosphatase A